MTNFKEQYVQIGKYFETALDGLEIDPAFAGAIKAMMTCPDTIAKIRSFNTTVWELVESCCNRNTIPIADNERWDFFIAGCTLLERIGVC